MGPHGLVAWVSLTGLRRRTLAKLIGELSGPWMKAGEDRLRGRRGHERKRAAGGGPDYDLPFTNRVIATLVYLRFQLPHAALAVLYGVDRSTITRAVGEIRPLLAARGFAVPGEAGVRLRTLADVFAYAAARGVELRLDGTEVQVRRPRCGQAGPPRIRVRQEEAEREKGRRHHRRGQPRPGRRVPPRADARPDRGADRGHPPTCSPSSPRSRPRSMPGTAGSKEFPDQVQAPPLKPKKDATPEETAAYEAERHKQSSERICVEHANAEHKRWRTLQRYLQRRTSTTLSWPSPAWSPTAPPNGNPHASQPARPARPTANRALRR